MYSLLEQSIDHLGKIFVAREWKYLVAQKGSKKEKTLAWPGSPEEKVMIRVRNGVDVGEEFHRHDFFFFNFAFMGNFETSSVKSDNRLIVREGEFYIGQPHTGHALFPQSDKTIVIAILIQKDTFFRKFLPVLASNAKLFSFFLDPQKNEYSEDFIHLCFDDPCCPRMLLEMMVIEYASLKEDTQDVLQSLVLTLLLLVARQYKVSNPVSENKRLSRRIAQYIGEHPDTATLKDIAILFDYNPNYISNLLRRETGKSFSEILLEQRMERAVSMLRNTGLAIEEIAKTLGYSNTSNFYKAFREFYGKSPRH